MSFDFYDFPDVSHQCALCKRFDCSKPGEKWLHFLTFLTDGDYKPAIGMTCLRSIFNNAGFTTQVIEKEVTRPPNIEDVTAVLMQLFEQMKAGEKKDDVPSTNAHAAATHTGNHARQRTKATPKGTG